MCDLLKVTLKRKMMDNGKEMVSLKMLLNTVEVSDEEIDYMLLKIKLIFSYSSSVVTTKTVSLKRTIKHLIPVNKVALK